MQQIDTVHLIVRSVIFKLRLESVVIPSPPQPLSANITAILAIALCIYTRPFQDGGSLTIAATS